MILITYWTPNTKINSDPSLSPLKIDVTKYETEINTHLYSNLLLRVLKPISAASSAAEHRRVRRKTWRDSEGKQK